MADSIEKNVTDTQASQAKAGATGPDTVQEPNEVTVESLAAELAAQKAEYEKLKTVYDKVCKSEGDMRKQLRAKMSAEEEAAAQKAEQEAQHQEYVKGLEKELAIIKSTSRYMSMGFDAETAKATATADYDGDKDTVASNIQKMLESQRKEMETKIRADLMADMPNPHSGNSGNVDYTEQLRKTREAGNVSDYISTVFAQGRANGFGSK